MNKTMVKNVSEHFNKDIFFYNAKEERKNENTKAVELIINCKHHPNENKEGNYSGPEDIKAANLALRWGLDVEDFCYSYYAYEVNYFNCKTVKDLIVRRRVLKEINRLIEEYNLEDYDLSSFPSEDLNDEIEYIGIYGPIFNYIFKDYNIEKIEKRINLCLNARALISAL